MKAFTFPIMNACCQFPWKYHAVHMACLCFTFMEAATVVRNTERWGEKTEEDLGRKMLQQLLLIQTMERAPLPRMLTLS